MAHILFVDGCMRGWEVSKTYSVAEKFLESYLKIHPEDTVDELHLSEESFSFLTGKNVERNDQLLAEGRLDASEFAMAQQFVKADKVLLAAPLWNMGLPAAVMAYFENVCVCNITFDVTEEQGMYGLCNAKKFLCIMTSGGQFGENPDDRAVVSYLRSLCNMLGIPETTHLWIEGLDIQDGQQDERLENGTQEALMMASTW